MSDDTPKDDLEKVSMLVYVSRGFRSELDAKVAQSRQNGETNIDGGFLHRNDYVINVLDEFAQENNFKTRPFYKKEK